MHRTLVDAEELLRHLDHPDWVVVDCRFSLADTERGRAAYRESHVPGAVYAHLDDDLSGPIIPGSTGRHPLPDPEKLAERFGSWGIGPAPRSWRTTTSRAGSPSDSGGCWDGLGMTRSRCSMGGGRSGKPGGSP